MCVHLPDGSTFLLEIDSNFQITFSMAAILKVWRVKIRLRQSMRI